MKYISLFLTVFIFQGVSFAQSSFSAQLSLPENVVQGETCTFKLDIYKPENVIGYTVFTQQFPEGFYVKGIELNGAQFEYKDNELKITWLRIPANAKVTILYEVSPMFGITGIFNFTGELSYLIGSNQGVFKLKKYNLDVLKERKVVSDNQLNENDNTAGILTYSQNKDISCKRTQFFNDKKNEYIIELNVKKEIGGSCHIIEKIPKNFSFSEILSKEAEIIQYSDKVMFYWKSSPNSKDFVLKYKLTPAEGQSEKPLLIGKLSVLIGGRLIEIPIIQ